VYVTADDSPGAEFDTDGNFVTEWG